MTVSPFGEVAYDPVKTPYEIDEAEFPRAGSLEEQKEFLLRYVILAPSTYNTQPWKFVIDDNGIEVYADYSRRLTVADPDNRELIMSIGAALLNLRVAAEHFGFTCRVHYDHSGASDRPMAVAILGLKEGPPEPGLDSLFSSIHRRHTNRNPFLVSRIPQSVVSQFTGIAAGARASMMVSVDGRLNEHVADLVAAADRLQLADPSYRKDVAEWLRPNWSEKTDGIPGASLGVKGVSAALAPWATKMLDLGRIRGANDRNLCIEAPGLLVLHSEDSVPHWLDVGELLERVLLTIVREGLQYSYFNMPIQVPQLRLELRTLLGFSTWPQILLRIGYSLTEPTPTPRRPVEEVLMNQRSV